jgi:hypothetical protein
MGPYAGPVLALGIVLLAVAVVGIAWAVRRRRSRSSAADFDRFDWTSSKGAPVDVVDQHLGVGAPSRRDTQLPISRILDGMPRGEWRFVAAMAPDDSGGYCYRLTIKSKTAYLERATLGCVQDSFRGQQVQVSVYTVVLGEDHVAQTVATVTVSVSKELLFPQFVLEPGMVWMPVEGNLRVRLLNHLQALGAMPKVS